MMAYLNIREMNITSSSSSSLSFCLLIHLVMIGLALLTVHAMPSSSSSSSLQQELEQQQQQQQPSSSSLLSSSDLNELQLQRLLLSKRGNNLGRKLMCQIDHRNCRSFNEAKRMMNSATTTTNMVDERILQNLANLFERNPDWITSSMK
uniref:Uncharacterized protein LOC113796969 n=1 Tax=Dermatophagoides pteronyssinus TaxID=6956 RepID=A0A6P6YDW0_DERPT|nr:uncharacterized protein LOC113796969 [Dermatophagoides pteronyssinus]